MKELLAEGVVLAKYGFLKPAKRAIRAGDFPKALGLLKVAEQIAHESLNEQGQQDALPIIQGLYALTYDHDGVNSLAEKHYDIAVETFNRSNVVGHAILLRDYSWFALRCLRNTYHAEELANEATGLLDEAQPSKYYAVAERIFYERIITRGYTARVILEKGEAPHVARAELRAVDEHLKGCTKRYRELENLLYLINHVGWVERRRQLVRAFRLAGHVNNPRIYAELSALAVGDKPLQWAVRKIL